MCNDCIEIRDLVVFANHGVLPEEKSMGQKFVISMKLYTDMERAADTDDIADAVNYAEVCAFVTEFTKINRCKLIEAAADNIARALLMSYPTVSSVEITLKKPWAPIGLPLDSVAVKIKRSRARVYLSIGSNLGEKSEYLDFAVKSIEENEACILRKVSDYYETVPVGDVEQDNFLNACIALDTVLSPHELLDFVNSVESKAGRTREIHWGPRTLDIDILLYDDRVIHDERLTIPHREMHWRKFVLEPLVEIAPYAYHPVMNEYAVNLLGVISDDNA